LFNIRDILAFLGIFSYSEVDLFVETLHKLKE